MHPEDVQAGGGQRQGSGVRAVTGKSSVTVTPEKALHWATPWSCPTWRPEESEQGFLPPPRRVGGGGLLPPRGATSQAALLGFGRWRDGAVSHQQPPCRQLEGRRSRRPDGGPGSSLQRPLHPRVHTWGVCVGPSSSSGIQAALLCA